MASSAITRLQHHIRGIMEPLSGVSSAFAVVSLTIQFADSIRKLTHFWESIKQAPEDIQGIITDLELTSDTLDEISNDASNLGSSSHCLGLHTLKRCSETVGRLHDLVNDIFPGLSSERRRIRTWSAVKAVMRDEKIRKFQDTLKDLKTTLILTSQASSR